MLKFVFWALLAANAVLLAYGQGYLGTFKSGEREPERVRSQLAIDKLKLVTGDEAKAAAASVVAPQPAPAEAPAAATPGLVACTEVGTFSAAEARRYETKLARLDLGERQSRQSVQAQEVTSRLVYLPPQGSKEAAERKSAELRGLGVTNSFIMNADGPFKWAISLGVFKTESGAQALLASLGKQGVKTAKIAPRGPQVTRFAYQFRDIDAATRVKLTGFASAIGEAEVRNCQ